MATTSRSKRRELRFEHVSEIMPEVDRLLGGYRNLGAWTLGQICNHLAATFRYSIEGFPSSVPWIVRRTLGPLVLRRVLTKGRMPDRVPAPSSIRPATGLDDRAEAEALRASIRIFEEFLGPVPEHPFFGQVTKAHLAQLHAIHAAHHLSFLLLDREASA